MMPFLAPLLVGISALCGCFTLAASAQPDLRLGTNLLEVTDYSPQLPLTSGAAGQALRARVNREPGCRYQVWRSLLEIPSPRLYDYSKRSAEQWSGFCPLERRLSSQQTAMQNDDDAVQAGVWDLQREKAKACCWQFFQESAAKTLRQVTQRGLLKTQISGLNKTGSSLQ